MDAVWKIPYKKTFLFCLSLLILLAPIWTRAQDSSSEQINNYQTFIAVNSDGSINVKEEIDYNFGTNQRHGIFRDIPYSYRARGGKFNLRISDVSVSGESGTPEPFTNSKSGGELHLKIGDPEKTISGHKVYVIQYTVRRALNFLAEQDEIYWNAVGTEWTVPILKAEAQVALPFDASAEHAQAKCFIGPFESTEESCVISALSNNTIAYSATTALSPGEGLTIVAGFPKGLIPPPSLREKVVYILEDNWVLGLPILVFVVMFRLWWKRGRDPRGRGTIVPQYEILNGLTPLETGIIADEKVNKQDIAAEIIYLAVKGYIKIKYTETKKLLVFKDTDYEIEKIKDMDQPAESTPAQMMLALLGGSQSVKISDFKKQPDFQKSLEELKSEVNKQLTNKGYFLQNPKTVKIVFLVAGLLCAFLGAWALGFAVGFYGAASAIVSGVIIILFGIFMPARTKKGVEAKEHILGLKEYLSVAEKDRIKFHNAPEKKPEVFEKLLPFAIALGVETQWAKQFEGMYNQSPAWYSSSHPGTFNSLVLVSSLNGFSSSVNSAVAHGQASGGGSGFSGGFSGGGFGGGGGGSW